MCLGCHARVGDKRLDRKNNQLGYHTAESSSSWPHSFTQHPCGGGARTTPLLMFILTCGLEQQRGLCDLSCDNVRIHVGGRSAVLEITCRQKNQWDSINLPDTEQLPEE